MNDATDTLTNLNQPNSMSRDWLIQWRKTKFSTQAAIADAAGISSARYSRLEHGYSDIRTEEADALAKVLNVTREAVLTGVVQPPAKQLTPIVTPTATPVAVQPSKPVANVRNDDLTDPKNFTLLPPTSLLSQSAANSADVTRYLKDAIIQAEKILHTSKIRAQVWVAWRDFSRNAQAYLRAPQAPRIDHIQIPPPTPVAAVFAKPAPSPTATTSTRPRGNKNVYGHFVDIARATLSPETNASITDKATAAKQNQPETGFMKHFHRIARESLPPDVFDRLDYEAKSRDAK